MVEDFILLELKFEHTLLFIMNGGRVRGACKLSSKVALQRVSGRKGNSDDSQETVIEPVSWPGQFVWSHLGLSVFPLDQLLGCVCKTFTFFRPPPPSVGDFAQPRGRLNIKFFYCFLIKLPWFSRMACTLPCGADTARCAIISILPTFYWWSGQNKTKQNTYTPKLDFPESLAAGRCLSDIVLASKVAGRGSPQTLLPVRLLLFVLLVLSSRIMGAVF